MNAWARIPVAEDDFYKKALERRQQLRKELVEVENLIALVERLFTTSDIEKSAKTPPRTGSRPRGIVPPRQLAKLAREVLIEAGRPMTRSEIASALESRDIPLAGRDKAKNLGTILWRYQDEFLSLPGRGYWPKDVANPSIGYQPDSSEG